MTTSTFPVGSPTGVSAESVGLAGSRTWRTTKSAIMSALMGLSLLLVLIPLVLVLVVYFGGDLVKEIRALKEQPGQDIVVTGSITLCHTLIEAGLVDEYRLFVYPVVQGRGRRLFPDGFELPRLDLLESKAFESGITYSRYAAP